MQTAAEAPAALLLKGHHSATLRFITHDTGEYIGFLSMPSLRIAEQSREYG